MSKTEIRGVTHPVHIVPDCENGDLLRTLYETLLEERSVGWLKFEFRSESSAGRGPPRYQLTMQWCKGPGDPPQAGPLEALTRQLDWVEAFATGFVRAGYFLVQGRP
jgi:hypothetical protein